MGLLITLENLIIRHTEKILLVPIVYSLILFYAPGIPPDVEFGIFNIDPAQPLTGRLVKNTYLDSAEKLHENVLIGPESIASINNKEIYVSTETGEIVKIYGKNFSQYQIMAKFDNKNCESKGTCGRPVGIKFAKNGLLYVAHTGLGIFSLDINTGKLRDEIDASIPTDGKKGMLINDVDVDKDGNIYWTESSLVSDIHTSLVEVMAKPTARFLKYDAGTKRRQVLLEDLHVANGVQLSPKEDFILVNECTGRRTLRYWLKGTKKGQKEVFVSNLPGFPDNIRPNKGGGYSISMVSVDPPGMPDVMSGLANYPTIRKLIMKNIGLLKITADVVNRVFPNCLTELISKKSFSFTGISKLMDSNMAVSVNVDEEGEIIDSLQGYSGKMKMMSEVQTIGDNIFIASPYLPYLGKLPLSTLEKLKKDEKERQVEGKEEL